MPKFSLNSEQPNASHHTVDSVNSFKCWTRTITIFNIILYIIRLYLVRSCSYSLLCSVIGAFILASLPSRPLDYKWCMAQCYALTIITPLIVLIRFGCFQTALSIFLIHFIISHNMNVISFNLIQKCSSFEELSNKYLHALNAKNEFVANVSHELRGPLLGLGISLELLQKTQLTQSQKIHFDTIESCSTVLQSLINDILLYSKLNYNQQTTVTQEPFSLNQCVHDIHKIVEAYAQSMSVKIDIMVDSDVPDKLIGDSSRLQQILLKLLSNSVIASKEDDIVALRIRTSGYDTSKQEHNIVFEVEDNGAGIPEEKRHLIFLPFSQLKTIPERKVPSSGLGLAVCKTITERLGGTVSFWSSTSEHNTGTIFTVTLPFKVYEDEQDPCSYNDSSQSDSPLVEGAIDRLKFSRAYLKCCQDCSEEELSYPSSQQINVVIAEDNRICQDVLRRILRNQGYNVVKCVENGKELVDYILSSAPADVKPDVILTDYHMPKLLGHEAASIIRHRYPSIKTVMLTGACDYQLPESLTQSIDKILYKPVKSDELCSAISGLVCQ
jgi:signal transduction histidine kinase/ActR/RegA family two-component response regulator